MKVSELFATVFLVFVLLFVSTSIITLICLYFGYKIPYYKEVNNILFGLLMFSLVVTGLSYNQEVKEEVELKEGILDDMDNL